MKKLLFLIAISVIIFFGSCKESINDPVGHEEGSRNYVWSTDTIRMAQARTIWGMTPNEMWLVNYPGNYSMNAYHFDGLSWRVKFPIMNQQNIQTLVGTSPTNIWLIAGNKPKVYLFDGITSNLHTDITLADYQEIIIEDICSNAPWNIYGVGRATRYSPQNITVGVILHYDGLKWSYLEIPSIFGSFNKVYIDEKNGVIISGYNTSTQRYAQWYYENNNLKEIINTGENYIFANLKNETILAFQRNVYKFNNGDIQEILDFKVVENYIEGIWGRTTSDFFVKVKIGIAHYNGSTLQIVYPLPDNSVVKDAIIFDKEVVFAIYNPATQHSIIVRGKLADN